MKCIKNHKDKQIKLASKESYWWRESFHSTYKTGKKIKKYYLCSSCGEVYSKIFSYHKDDGYEVFSWPKEYQTVLEEIQYWERCKYNTQNSKESRDAITITCPQYQEILTNLIKGQEIIIETCFNKGPQDKKLLQKGIIK